MLKQVVLPAPLGPISAWIEPRRTRKRRIGDRPEIAEGLAEALGDEDVVPARRSRCPSAGPSLSVKSLRPQQVKGVSALSAARLFRRRPGRRRIRGRGRGRRAASAVAASRWRISVGRKIGLAFEHQRDDAGDQRARHRGAGLHRIAAAGRGQQHIDAGGGDRDIGADIGAGVELVVGVGGGGGDDVGVGAGILRRRGAAGVAGRADQRDAALRSRRPARRATSDRRGRRSSY